MDSTLTSKGQVTIPKAIRDRWKLSGGDRVKFFELPDGSVRIFPLLRASRLFGMLKHTGKPVSMEEIEEASDEAWGRRWKRFEQQGGK